MSVPGVLTKIATLRSEAPVFVTIREAEVSGSQAINDRVLYTGEVTNASVKGGLVTGKVVSGGSMYDRRVPRVLFQRTCNNSLFDTGCALLKLLWKFTATVQSVGAAGYPFEFVLEDLARVTGPTPDYTENWFAGGWIEFGTGLTWQRRPILISSGPDVTLMTVTLDRDPNPFPEVGDPVVLYPGCDGTTSNCKLKFANYLNSLGHPFMPSSNPSFVRKSISTGGGKK